MKAIKLILIILLITGCAVKKVSLQDYQNKSTLDVDSLNVIGGVVMASGKPANGVLKLTEDGYSVTWIDIANSQIKGLHNNVDIVMQSEIQQYIYDNDVNYLLGATVEYDKDNKEYVNTEDRSKIENGRILAVQQKAEITIFIELTDGKPNGSLKAFYFDYLYLEQQYINGVKNGKGAYYPRSGSIMKYTYNNGLLNGEKSFTMYRRGLIKTEHYNNGVLENVKEYNNGKIKSFMPYKNGVPEGRKLFYNSQGKVYGYIDYVNGKAEGLSVYQYLNEPKYKHYEVNYTNGEKNGIMRYYYKSGRLAAEVTYENGEVILPYTGYNEDGTVKYKYSDRENSYCTDANGAMRRMFNDYEKKYSISGLISMPGICEN